MDTEEKFRLFGNKSTFALELRLASDQPDGGVPLDSRGSWGSWRMWVADVNLCRLQFDTEMGVVEVQEVRWFLAPLFRWLATMWLPLLHESRLPREVDWGDRQPRWARLAYLAMIERAGDTIHFRRWQDWAERHALRAIAEGGIVPDIFFQRIGDEMELTWGDRIQPGGEAATFLVEDGVARVPIDDFARALLDSTNWFYSQPAIKAAEWAHPFVSAWQEIEDQEFGLEPLYWYLDAQSKAGALSTKFIDGLKSLNKPVPEIRYPWLGNLAPEVAMFGDLTPKITQAAAVTLLTEYFNARNDEPEPAALAEMAEEEPAWASTSPFENGYSLALDVLDIADPDPKAESTDLEAILANLSIMVRNVELGLDGPRGVAFAGEGLRPTILVNTDHRMNYGLGRRFTEAHELCHILFDRKRAKPLAHSSTQWAPTSVEQRANAFAAMLLMPIYRAKRPLASTLASLSRGVSILAGKLGVSRIALRRHLANLGEIDGFELDHMLGGKDAYSN